MESGERMSGSILYACLIAGPVFLTSLVSASLYLKLPQPIVVSAGEFGAFVVLILPALIVGFLLALIPVTIGTAALFTLGEQNAAFRLPGVWTAVGAAIGIALVILLQLAGPWREAGFALVVTSAVCARVARNYVNWEN